jgi:hypothetical protein
MSRRQKTDDRSTMLDLWRPPRGAGDPIGCLATTYTFHPGLFDEQCLGRFFGIESEPRRESLAFLLEREMCLGSAYAGVVVDASAAGVPHSLRWDVLPVRIPRGRQHAKVSLLAWQDHVRLIVASANLTRPGYRSNFEVAAPIDFSAADCDGKLLADALAFLRSLLALVPGGPDLVETKRAADFLGKVAALTADWKAPSRGGLVRHRLACTLPGRGAAARGAFDEFIAACRSRGTLPYRMWIASPFFDDDAVPSRAAEAVCRQMARGAVREVWLCAPGTAGGGKGTTLIHAPRAVYDTFVDAGAKIHVEIVPDADDGEPRKWHAKMVHAFADSYVALMVGSSNFTAAGLGLAPTRNAEANLVTLVDQQDHAREEGLLRSVWNAMEPVADPERASWQQLPEDDEEDAAGTPVPAGFIAATFHAADPRRIVLRLAPDGLPDSWTVRAAGGVADGEPVIGSADWAQDGGSSLVEVPWAALEPPERLRIHWDEHHAFMPLNVADALALPVPSEVRDMTADEMLEIIASADPGAAIRVWGGRRQPADPLVDGDLDSADPVDLDPLSRYRLADTFLHRVRRHARVMADLRRFVERPVATEQSLEWRLRGFVGIEPLAQKFAAEFEAAGDRGADPREALLTLADLLIVLRDARYEPAEGSLSATRFQKRYDTFLGQLARQLDEQVRDRLEGMASDVATFWRSVVERCLR